ncbi:hypothetical protein D3C78_1309620 [compost metagenome]
MLLQRPGKSRARIDFGAQRGQQMVLVLVFGLVGQRAQRALQRQAGGDQPGELACPDGQRVGVEHRPREPAFLPGQRRAGRVARTQGVHGQRHQGLGAQQVARGLGSVGFQGALAGGALGVYGFVGKSRHGKAAGKARKEFSTY